MDGALSFPGSELMFRKTKAIFLGLVLCLGFLPVAHAGTELQLLIALNGTPRYLGTIVATTTKNNHDTATPFNNTGDALKGKLLLIQTDAACYINFGTTNAITAVSSATTGAVSVKLNADERVIVRMDPESGYGWIAALAVSGTANIKVWDLKER
jgi:hypothetical protein